MTTAVFGLAAPNTPVLADVISTPSSSNPVSVQKYGRTWYEYYLTSPSALTPADPNATSPQVVATLPSGVKIDPPDSTLYPYNNSPQAFSLTYNDSSGKQQTTANSSSGFDQSQMVLGLNSNLNNGQQLFGLSFFGSGLKATNAANPSSGGLADLWLSFDNSVTSQPLFQSVTPSGVSLLPVPKSTSTTNPTTTTTGTSTSTSTTTHTPAPAPTPTATPAVSHVPEPMSIVLWSAVIGAGLIQARGFRRRHAA
jgi:hypothetical protein